MPLPLRLVDALGQVEDALVHLVIPGRDWDPHIKQKFLYRIRKFNFYSHIDFPWQVEGCPRARRCTLPSWWQKVAASHKRTLRVQRQMPRGKVEGGGGRLVAVAASVLDLKEAARCLGVKLKTAAGG